MDSIVTESNVNDDRSSTQIQIHVVSFCLHIHHFVDAV